MYIEKITVLMPRYGCDQIVLHLPIVEGTWPYKNKASAKMDVASGGGEEYVKQHFPGIKYEIIKIG